MTDRGREVTFALALLLALVAGVGLEMGFRAFKAEPEEPGVDWAAMVDSIGVTDPATQRARFAPGSSFGAMQFNSFGLRGPEVPMFQPPDLVRIAFLGDSKVMSANYSEEQSFSGQVVAQLAVLVPQCRFDYVTMAGPGYTVPFIADLWAEIAPATSPDLAVMLAGTVGEMTAMSWSTGSRPLGRQTWLDAWLADSWLLAAAQRHLYAVSARFAPPPAAELDLVTLVKTHQSNFAPLVEVIADTPVIALGYRGRLRRAQPFEDQARFATDLQLAMPGLSVTEAILLTEMNVAALARLTQEANWTFIDPIADIPTAESHYVDNQHFSATGLADIAARIAAVIAPQVQADCTIAHNLRSDNELWRRP